MAFSAMNYRHYTDRCICNRCAVDHEYQRVGRFLVNLTFLLRSKLKRRLQDQPCPSKLDSSRLAADHPRANPWGFD
jgi:hypothetical protein